MRLAPSVVVVVVDGVDDLRSENSPYTIDDPLASRIGILAGERHAREIACAELL
jgi:hypothetical protein